MGHSLPCKRSRGEGKLLEVLFYGMHLVRLTGGGDGTVSLYLIQHTILHLAKKFHLPNLAAITSLSLSPDGREALAGTDFGDIYRLKAYKPDIPFTLWCENCVVDVLHVSYPQGISPLISQPL